MGRSLISYLWWYPLCSVLTFLLYWHDKRQAQRGGWRVPELRLQLMALLGGWPGAFLAQRILRHKNRKIWFQVGFWSLGLVHLAVLLLLVYGPSLLNNDLKSALSSLISFLY